MICVQEEMLSTVFYVPNVTGIKRQSREGQTSAFSNQHFRSSGTMLLMLTWATNQTTEQQTSVMDV